MATFIPADDTQPTREVTPKNGRDFTFQELYALIGCSVIELVHLPNGHLMVIDEEGKFTSEPQRNARATKLAGFISPTAMKAYLKQLERAGIHVIQASPDPFTEQSTETDYIAGNALVCRHDEIR